MTPNIISGSETQSVRDICKIMYKNKVGSIIIAKDTLRGFDNTTKKNTRDRDRKRLRSSYRIF